jgi:hypothetical protein
LHGSHDLLLGRSALGAYLGRGRIHEATDRAFDVGTRLGQLGAAFGANLGDGFVHSTARRTLVHRYFGWPETHRELLSKSLVNKSSIDRSMKGLLIPLPVILRGA